MPAGGLGRLIGLGRTAEAAAVLHHPARAVGLVFGVRAPLDSELLVQPTARLQQPLRARAWDRPGLFGAPLIQPSARVAQPPLATLARRERRRQLIAAPLAELLVLGRVDLGGLFEDLARDLLVIARRPLGRVGMHLRAVNRDDPDADHPRVRAQPQHLPEQLAQRPLVTDPKARDRRVIGRLVGGDHPERDILAAAPLDPPRRALPDRVRVHDQRHHHRRIVRRRPVTVGAIRGKERSQIELADRVDHKPREVILSQPLTQARRQQQLLLAITRQEVLRHPGIVLNRPDGPTFVRQPPWKASSQRVATALSPTHGRDGLRSASADVAARPRRASDAGTARCSLAGTELVARRRARAMCAGAPELHGYERSACRGCTDAGAARLPVPRRGRRFLVPCWPGEGFPTR